MQLLILLFEILFSTAQSLTGEILDAQDEIINSQNDAHGNGQQIKNNSATNKLKYSESLLEYIGINKVNLEKDYRLEKAKNIEGNIHMREDGSKGALISFKNSNREQSSSFEIIFNSFNMKFPDSAGLYVWYSSDTVDTGGFKGISGQFHGFMVGIEYFDKYADIVVTSNDGTHDYSKIPNLALFRDKIDPDLLRNIKDLKMKIISTPSNFKVELYDNSKIIYDRVKMVESRLFGDQEVNRKISVTAHYAINDTSKAFVIKEANFYRRVEDAEYDPYYSPVINLPITKSSKEVQHAIGDLEYFKSYLEIVLGKPEDFNLISQMNIIITENQKNKSLMEELTKKIVAIELEGTKLKKMIGMANNISVLNTNIKAMQRRIGAIKHAFNILEAKNSTSSTSNIIAGLITMILGIIAVGLKVFKKLDKGKK